MINICEDLRKHVPEIVRTWEELLEKQPWFLQPKDPQKDNLPVVVLELVNAALCDPGNEEAHRRKVQAAAELGWLRRESGLPEHVMFTEFHALRQAIWYYLDRKFGPSDTVSQAIFRIDAAISLATNASMWGYHRAEIEALGKWDEGIRRIIRSSPFLRRTRYVSDLGREFGSRSVAGQPARGDAPDGHRPGAASGGGAPSGPSIPNLALSDALGEPEGPVTPETEA